MLQQLRAAAPGVLVAATLTLAGYALGGVLAPWLAVDPRTVQDSVLALYASAAAMVGAEAIPRLWRARPGWPALSAVALRGIGAALALFSSLRLLPDLALGTTPWPAVDGALGFAGMYLHPLRAISIAVLFAGIALSLYRASFPLWRHVPARAAIEAFVVSVAARYLLDSQGPVTVRTSLDLAFYSWPVWVAAAGYAAFWLIRLSRVSRSAHTLAAVVLWASVAAAAYLAFHYLNHLAVELAVSERYQQIGEQVMPYLSVAAGIDRWAAAGIAILGLERSTSGYTARWHRRRLGPLFEAGRSLSLGVVVWGAAQEVQPLGTPAGLAGVVGFSALAGVSAGQAARLLVTTPPRAGVTAAGAAWLAGSTFRNANIGGLIALYATVLRPSIYEATMYAPLIEWLGLAVPAAYLIARAAGGVASQTDGPPALPAWREWRLHRQNANPLPDRPLTRAAAMREGFVETGEASGLAVRVITAMHVAGRPEDEIALAVRPLVDLQVPGRRRSGMVGFLFGGSAAARARVARSLAADQMEKAMRSSSAGTPSRSVRDGNQEAIWAEARRAFVENGDRVRLGVAATMLGWNSGATREVLITQFGRIVQYRDERSRWYDLRSARRRKAELAPAARVGFADQLRSSAASLRRSEAASEAAPEAAVGRSAMAVGQSR